MSVQDVLQKITHRNEPVIGCIVRSGDAVHHNLTCYGVDCDEIVDSMSDVLDLTAALDEGGGEIDTVWSEFDGNSLVAQRIGDATLVALTDRIPRPGFKKLQVNLSLQTRLLAKALKSKDTSEADTAPTPSAPLQSAAPPIGETHQPADDASDPADGPPKKKKRFYRGSVYWE